jgi:hypothetical protein
VIVIHANRAVVYGNDFDVARLAGMKVRICHNGVCTVCLARPLGVRAAAFRAAWCVERFALSSPLGPNSRLSRKIQDRPKEIYIRCLSAVRSTSTNTYQQPLSLSDHLPSKRRHYTTKYTKIPHTRLAEPNNPPPRHRRHPQTLPSQQTNKPQLSSPPCAANAASSTASSCTPTP